MNYAIIKTGSKQYQVTVGQTLKVELLTKEVGPVVFDQVLLHVAEGKASVGTPTVEGVNVYATLVGEVKADKVQVFKYKSKSRYRKLRGHRQRYSLVKIDSIGVSPAKETKTATKKPSVKAENSVPAKPKGQSSKKAPAKKSPPKAK